MADMSKCILFVVDQDNPWREVPGKGIPLTTNRTQYVFPPVLPRIRIISCHELGQRSLETGKKTNTRLWHLINCKIISLITQEFPSQRKNHKRIYIEWNLNYPNHVGDIYIVWIIEGFSKQRNILPLNWIFSPNIGEHVLGLDNVESLVCQIIEAFL